MDRSEWVLPAPMPHGECRDENTYAAGWNGCLNEARRLNAAPPPPAEQASGDHGKHMEVLERLEKALPDVGLNGWIDGVAAVQYARAALSQRPVVDEAMVGRACLAYNGREPSNAGRQMMRAAITAALEKTP